MFHILKGNKFQGFAYLFVIILWLKHIARKIRYFLSSRKTIMFSFENLSFPFPFHSFYFIFIFLTITM